MPINGKIHTTYFPSVCKSIYKNDESVIFLELFEVAKDGFVFVFLE